jgi:hypothetical protein
MVLASAALLRAEHRKHSALCRALLIQSRELKAELQSLKAMKGQNGKASVDLNNRWHRIWLSKNPR